MIKYTVQGMIHKISAENYEVIINLSGDSNVKIKKKIALGTKHK